MKAIEILFDKIDELNGKIKQETEMDIKIAYVARMSKIADIIQSIGILKYEYNCDNENYI